MEEKLQKGFLQKQESTFKGTGQKDQNSLQQKVSEEKIR